MNTPPINLQKYDSTCIDRFQLLALGAISDENIKAITNCTLVSPDNDRKLHDIIIDFQSCAVSARAWRKKWRSEPDREQKQNIENKLITETGKLADISCDIYKRMMSHDNVNINRLLVYGLYFWMHAHENFFPLMEIEYEKYFVRHQLNKYLERIPNGKIIEFVSASLIIENNRILVYGKKPDNRIVKSGEVIACHVSSGSMDVTTYRYMNFITKSGSVYWIYGCSLVDPENLLGRLHIISSH